MASSFSSKFISTSEEFPLHILGWLRIHKDGRYERLTGNDIVPAGTDTLTGVRYKDVIISSEFNVFARLYIPKTIIPSRKLPTLIYYHGGGFVTESAASLTYHPTLNLITLESNVIFVSMNYRLASEYPIPTAYEDSWEETKWVAAHANGNGPEPWLNDHADFQNVFFGGDSSGANISHNMAMRVGLSPIKDIKLMGVILLHPHFGGKDPIGGECEKQDFRRFLDHIWKLASPSWMGLDDPLINPDSDPHISSFGCSRILLCVGEKDIFKDRGLNYKKVIEKSDGKQRGRSCLRFNQYFM